MDFIGERYYKLNRIFLLCFGLWPDHPYSTLKKIQIIFFETLFISFLLFQIIYIYGRVRYDWNLLKTQAELKIIRGYADYAKLCTICFALLSINVLVFFILSSIPCILDIIVPMNDSRPRRLPILVEYYFIDKEVYFFITLIHIMFTQYAGCMIITAVGTLLIAYVLHTCAMFKIASYRIDHIFDENVQQMSKDLKQYVFYEKLIHAIYIHRRALDLAAILTDSFATLYFILLGFGVFSTTLTIVNLFNALSSNNITDILMAFGIIFIHLYYIFVGNYVGQEIIDASTDIHQSIYNTQWYIAPIWIQKLILFMMQRSKKRSTLTAGYLFDASLDGFATLMNMSLSYFMVFQSLGT